MIMDGLDCAGIRERCRDLDMALPVRNHLSGQLSRSQTREFGKESAIISMNLKRLNAYAGNQIGGVRTENHFSRVLGYAALDGQFQTMARSNADYVFRSQFRSWSG